MKFICSGGEIISKRDGDTHFITASELCRLYGVSQQNTKRDTCGVNYTWFELVPQRDGNYSLPDLINSQLEKKWKPLWIQNTTREVSSRIANHLLTKTSFIQRLKYLFTSNSIHLYGELECK